MKYSMLTTLLASVLFACVSFGRVPDQKDLVSKISNLLQWEEKFGFNGSVLIVKDGKKLFSRGYGYANKAKGLQNSPETVFYIASISKTITALAVMKLVENGQLQLTDPITKFFSNVPDKRKLITVEMLLKHTSGMAQTYSCEKITDRASAIETILGKTPSVAQPGTRYNYSGDGYSLLAAIIEISSGQRFEDFVANNILFPSGIHKTVNSGDIFPPENEVSASQPYMPYFTGRLHRLKADEIAAPIANSPFRNLKEIKSTWGDKGRSGMILSVEDLYKVDKAFREHKILGAGTVEKMLAAGIKSGGSGYGYGFMVGSEGKEIVMFGHTGDDDNIGHNMSYLDFPKEGLQIIVASNNGLYYSGASYSAVISSLLERLTLRSNYTYTENKPYPTFRQQPVENLDQYEGVYPSGTGSFHVWLNENQLILSPVGMQVPNTFLYSPVYAGKNELARQILQETHNGTYDLLQSNSADSLVFQRTKGIFANIWASLEKNNGPLQRIDILGTANIWSGNYHADHATWFKLVFKDKSQLYRMEWDVDHRIVGLGGGVIRYPMMFNLKAIAKNEFIGFDAGNGRTVSVIFQPAGNNGDRIMEVNSEGNKGLKLHNSGDVNTLPKRSAAALLSGHILSKGIPAVMQEAATLKERSNRFYLEEEELNEYGYKLLKQGKTNEAIAMFTILVQAFPASANGHDSLAEAYLKGDNKTEALKHYKRSLELNPKNENARKIIAQME